MRTLWKREQGTMRVFLAGLGGKPWLKNNYFDFYRLHSYEYLKKEKDEI